ncbi:hypothetical protein EOM82_08265 [bacterium]|nr:hypothetical protein [bacterium]
MEEKKDAEKAAPDINNIIEKYSGMTSEELETQLKSNNFTFKSIETDKETGVLFTTWLTKQPGADKVILYLLNHYQDIMGAGKYIEQHPDQENGELTIETLERLFEKIKTQTNISTTYPSSFISPTDKISNYLFHGELTGDKPEEISMERKGSKNQLTALACINFDALNGDIRFNGPKALTPYDREVHNAIATLYVDGKNDHITPQMIYQAMTGSPAANLNAKQAEAISDSITKFMYCQVIIDSTKEAKAYGIESLKYDSSLIVGERVTATLNGTTTESLHLFRAPVLYQYANGKNQIGRIDINLLNTPINKSEDIIVLQGYLFRRILSMKSKNPQSNIILYNTIYEELKITAATAGALRKKKSKLRDHIKCILDFWKKENFITDYKENELKNISHSITITIKLKDGRGIKW